jgi:hydroxyacylglutathione hydrolase
MFIKQIYTDCISKAAYYIESNGEAVVLDSLGDTEEYTRLAAERNTVIKYIFETHFHADFVSRHLDLGKKTNSLIVYGPQTVTSFPVHIAKDGEIFSVGNISFKVIHTPVHTIESCCYLLKDETGKDHALFTGNSLFVGDAGRPDLSSGNMTRKELAAIMYDTIQQKILPLADDVVIYPAHDAGSRKAKQLRSATSIKRSIYCCCYRWPAGCAEVFFYQCKNKQRRIRQPGCNKSQRAYPNNSSCI